MVVKEGIPYQHYYYLTYKQESYIHVVLESKTKKQDQSIET